MAGGKEGGGGGRVYKALKENFQQGATLPCKYKANAVLCFFQCCTQLLSNHQLWLLSAFTDAPAPFVFKGQTYLMPCPQQTWAIELSGYGEQLCKIF